MIIAGDGGHVEIRTGAGDERHYDVEDFHEIEIGGEVEEVVALDDLAEGAGDVKLPAAEAEGLVESCDFEVPAGDCGG